jgi:hypothetical protein
MAVILAFGLGILAGTSVVGDRFANDLQKNYDEAIAERDAALELIEFYEGSAEDLQPTLRDGVLAGERAIVVTTEGVDRQAQHTVEELTAAGVDVFATLRLSRRLAELDIEENAAVLEGILGVSGLNPESLGDRVADALAVRLGVGLLAEEDDVLGALLEEGLVTADRDLEPEALLGIGGGGQLLVIAAAGSPPEGFPPPESLLVPFTERLVRLDVTTAAVGQSEDEYGYVSAVRASTTIPDCSMVTVDDIDLVIGGITLAMAIDRFLEDPDPGVRPGGDYGIAGDSIVPGAEEPPESCRGE